MPSATLMSACPPIAEVKRTSRHVSFVPGRDSCTATNWTLVSRLNLGAPVLPLVRPRQYDLKLSEESGLRLDIDAATMLFHDDVVAHRQAKPGAFARGFGRKEWVEYLRFDLFRDTGSIIANTDFNLVSKVLRRGVEPVRYEIEKNSRDLLRIDFSHADGRIEVTLEVHTEACLFCSGTVIGQVKALIDDSVDVGGATLARPLARMQQHVLHDSVRAFAVLNNLVEVVLQ